MSEVRGGGQEELPHVRGQWRPGGDTPSPRSGAARSSHLVPEARGGDLKEPPGARGQGRQLGGATRSPRPGPAAGRSNRRSGGCAAQEGLEELSHVEGQEQWQ